LAFLPEMTYSEIVLMLEEERVGRIGLNDERQPYVVPTDFAYLDGAIYIHTPAAGRKARLAHSDPHVCFEVDRYNETVTDYRSVLVRGKIAEVSDLAERRKAMEAMGRKALKSGTRNHDDIPADALSRIMVFRIEIGEATGVRSPQNGNGHP